MSSRRRRLTAVALVVAVALVLAVVIGSRHRGGEAAGPPSPGATRPVAVGRGGGRVIDSRAARLGGRVLAAEGGGPVSGATVSVGRLGLDFGARQKPGESSDPTVATTDEGGRFDLAGLPPGRWTVSATAAGYRPATLEGIVLGGGEARADLELRVSRGGHRLEGTIKDIGGGVVEGALVGAIRTSEVSIGAYFRAPFTARSAADGRYALDLEDGDYYVAVNHADYVREDATLELRGQQHKDFTLTPGGSIEGVVRDRAGDRPVAGALVSHMPADQGGSFILSGVGLGGAVSGSDGRFVLRGLEAGAIQLRAVAPGVASAEATTVELGIAEQVTGVVLELDRAYTISGTVVARADKKPVSGALAGAYNLSPPAAYVDSEPTGDDGRFAIHGVRPGSFSIGAATDGRVPNLMAESVTVADKDLDGIEITLDAGARLRGRVEPPGPASLSVAIEGEVGFGNMLQAASAALVSGRAGADGAFELVGVPSGKFKIEATRDDGRAGELAVEVSGDREGLVVALAPRGSVAGVVVDGDGHPVADVMVKAAAVAHKERAFRLNDRARDGVTTGADGRFEMLGLADGPHEITVRAGARLSWADRKGDAAREPIKVEVAASAPVTGLRLVVEARRQVLRGTVIGPDGGPAVDAWVTATFVPDDGSTPWGDRPPRHDKDDPDDQKTRKKMRRWFPAEDPVLTDDAGRFEIKNLRRGSYDLHAELPAGGARGDLEGVASGQTVTVKLDPQAAVAGKVSRAGVPVTAFSVEVEGPVHRTEQFANPEGRYRVARLSPGEYAVSVTSPGGRAAGKTTLTAGADGALDLQLIAYGSVRGTVVDASSGKPLTGLHVWAMTEDGAAAGQQMMETMAGKGPMTDPAGGFRVGQLGAGKGQVMVFARKGFDRVASSEFTLAPGQDLDLGTLKGTMLPEVPDDQRGSLGFTTDQARWRSRPDAPAGEDPAPAGVDPEASQLWVAEVTGGGPAERAGVLRGDRITSVNGVPVDAVGPAVAATLLGEDRVAAGSTVTLGVARPGAPPRSIAIVAARASP